MLDVVASQDSQFDSTSDTVVGTQCGSLGCQPLAVNICLDGILVEVELYIHQFIAYHIHVALQDYRLAVLHTLGGRLTYNHIAGFVYFCIQIVALAP